MTKTCIGCGIELQIENKNEIGYTNNIDSNICQRCFNIKNYNKYEKIERPKELTTILKEISASNDLVLFVVDIFSLNNKIKEIINFLNNKVIICITKQDLVSNIITEDKIIDYVDRMKIKCLDRIVVSANKNYNLDTLIEMIKYYKTSENVYLAGYTNCGKSTLINKIIKNYSAQDEKLTTSMLPSTTLNTVKVKIDDELTLIDTPGIITSTVLDALDETEIKKFTPKLPIKPQIYQIKTKQTIQVENILALTIAPYNTVVFYLANNLKYERYYNDKTIPLISKKLKVDDNTELLINGLGTIKIKKKTELTIYLKENVEIETRKALM